MELDELLILLRFLLSFRNYIFLVSMWYLAYVNGFRFVFRFMMKRWEIDWFCLEKLITPWRCLIKWLSQLVQDSTVAVTAGTMWDFTMISSLRLFRWISFIISFILIVSLMVDVETKWRITLTLPNAMRICLSSRF